MNIKRIVEIDTRTAMDKVRELFGDDAVILSNKKLGKKVEIIAAIDLEDGVVDFNQSKSATIGKESTDHEYESFFKVMQNQNNPVDYQTLSAEAHYKAQQQITNHGHQPHQSFTAIDRRHSQYEGSPAKLRAGNKGHSGSTTPSIKLNNGKKTPELKSTVKATTKIKKTTTPKTALSKNKRKTQSNAKKTTPIENNKAQNIEPIIGNMNAQNSKSDQIIESMSTELSTLRNLIESHFQNSNTTDSPIESEAIL
ncbi:MAG: hypothetical protein HOG42_06575, partial [Methylococcales bacterium]|nr:hypothetical protein [Methylococcales bacterium]